VKSRMAVCTSNTETSSAIAASYNVSYPSSISGRTSCLPNGGEGWTGSAIDSTTGLVSSTNVDSQVASLISKMAVAPGPTVSQSDTTLSQTNLNSASNFSTNSALLRASIDNEYCYYYVRYNWLLQSILTTAVTATAAQIAGWQSDSSSDYYKKKVACENINRKLNQILQVLQSIVNNRLNTLNTYYSDDSGVNKINRELNTIRTKLQRDATNLNNIQMEQHVKTAMVDYTIEKNNASRNLLAVYGFLNIVAIGMIFYLYRNTKGQ
jgi:hypothetical protein